MGDYRRRADGWREDVIHEDPIGKLRLAHLLQQAGSYGELGILRLAHEEAAATVKSVLVAPNALKQGDGALNRPTLVRQVGEEMKGDFLGHWAVKKRMESQGG